MDWSLISETTFSSIFSLETIVFVLAAMGLNFHYGYTGLMNFGQAAFLAAGAYGVAISFETFGWSMWVGIPVGILFSMLLALLLGIPTLRLRGDYLAIVTIAASEIIRLIARSEALEDITGGNSGINGFANPFYDLNPFKNGEFYQLGPFKYLGARLWVQIVGWIVVALVALVTYLLVRSPWGRVLKSIRENEDAARSLGKNVYGYKMQALMIGGVIGALGGILGAIGDQSVQPDSFVTRTTFIAYACLILGGAARVGGPILGGVIFYVAFRFLDVIVDQMEKNNWVPDSVVNSIQAGLVRFMFLGIALMLLMVFRPQGILGNKRELELGDH